MKNKNLLIKFFLTVIYLIILYSLTRCSLFALAENVEIEREVSCVINNNPPMSIHNVVEVKAQKKIEYRNLGEFKLTGYCSCTKCCGKTDGITATGTVATAGRTIAVDPSVIPYGSVIKINDKEYVAEDCGGAIKNNKIDIFFDSHEEALAWGVKYADVYVKLGD